MLLKGGETYEVG